MKQIQQDKFSLVQNQCKNRTNAISDSSFLKFASNSIATEKDAKVVEMFFNTPGMIEVTLDTGEIIQVCEVSMRRRYMRQGMC